MLRLNLNNTGVTTKSLDPQIASLLKKPAALFLTPYNQDLSEILEFAKKVRAKYNHFVVIGMGGSIMGAKTLHECLGGDREMTFIDNLDPNFTVDLKALYIFVSKSGSTLETMSLFQLIKPKLKKDQILVITSQTQSSRYKTFIIPKEISGRFSVFTPCGLLPAALCGINIEKLLKGVRKIKLNGMPAKLAYAQYKLKKRAIVPFVYANKFYSFLEWYKQLLGESLGKNSTIGADPITAIGPKDQHSLLQLLQAGPNDKFVIFIEVSGGENKLAKIIAAELKATEEVIKQKNARITLEKLDEEHVGQLLFLFMAQIALLGELYKINAFNQPGVEAGKKITRKILGQN